MSGLLAQVIRVVVESVNGGVVVVKSVSRLVVVEPERGVAVIESLSGVVAVVEALQKDGDYGSDQTQPQ